MSKSATAPWGISALVIGSCSNYEGAILITLVDLVSLLTKDEQKKLAHELLEKYFLVADEKKVSVTDEKLFMLQRQSYESSSNKIVDVKRNLPGRHRTKYFPITVHGKTYLNMREIENAFNIKRNQIYRDLYAGLTPEEIFIEPPKN